MKFALLGCQSTITDLLHALANESTSDQDFELVAAYVPKEFRDVIHAEFPQVRWLDSWETMLEESTADAILIGCEIDEESADQLRKLTQAGRDLWLAQPSCQSLIGYEMDMIRMDIGGELFDLGRHWHPALQMLNQQVETAWSTAGRPPQVNFERILPSHDRDFVEQQLAADMSIMRAVVGDFRHISAQGQLSEDGAVHESFTIQLQTEMGGMIHWNLSPKQADRQAKITVQGQQAVWELRLPDASEWRLLEDDNEQQTWSPTAWVQPNYQGFLEHVKHHRRSNHWSRVCRDIEIAELAYYSLRRGRTVELYDETRTEEGAFKGVMAMGGCALILFGMFALMIVVLVDSLRLSLRESIFWRLWPVYLLAPFALFVIMQLLRLAVPKPPTEISEDKEQTDAADAGNVTADNDKVVADENASDTDSPVDS